MSVEPDSWTYNISCFLMLCVVLWYSYSSQILLSLFSLARLMIVVYPLHSRFKKANFVIRNLLFGLLISLIVSVSSTVIFKQERNAVALDICFPFFNPTKSISLQFCNFGPHYWACTVNYIYFHARCINYKIC